jgi:DnaJ-class molecular chaperone
LKKNFYKILGVTKESDAARIKKGYRRAAKRFHPDVSPQNEEKFREVQEAYETLSDPEKRALYDQEFLKKPVRKTRPFSTSPQPGPTSLLGEIERFFTDFNGFWENDLEGSFRSTRESRQDIYVTLRLTPSEARRGRKVPIDVPVWRECSRCHGTGRAKTLICGLCRGKGRTKAEVSVSVPIPPKVEDGMRLRILISAEGIRLVVTLRVTD